MSDTSKEDLVWNGDLLNRRAEAEFLQAFLKQRQRDAETLGSPFSFVLNVNGDWGFGKSYLLERFAKTASLQGHIVAEINAWASDFADDPLLPVMSSIEKAIKPHLKTPSVQERWNGVQENLGPILLATGAGLFRGAVNRFAPGAAEAVADALQIESEAFDEVAVEGLKAASERAIDTLTDGFAAKAIGEFEKTQTSIKRFRDDLAAVLKLAGNDNVPMPMLVFVDELDRCRPSYAVSMLERIKHLFNLPNVVFLIATNTDQLQHSIAAVYGERFASARYLHRFFDMTYTLRDPDLDDFVVEQLSYYPLLSQHHVVAPDVGLQTYMVVCFEAFGLTPRDVQQCISLINVVASTIKYKPFWALLVPLACGHQRRWIDGTFAEAIEILKTQSRSDWHFPDFRGSDGRPAAYTIATVLQRIEETSRVSWKSLNEWQSESLLEGWIKTQLLSAGVTNRRLHAKDYLQLLKRAGHLEAVR